MAHGDAREGMWRGNWRMERVASTLHTTSEHEDKWMHNGQCVVFVLIVKYRRRMLCICTPSIYFQSADRLKKRCLNRKINWVDCVWNVMAHAQNPDVVFRRNGRVHLNRRGASVQSTTGSRGVRISGSNAWYTTFRGSVKGTGYPLHSPVSPSLPLPCVTVCHHISTELNFRNVCNYLKNPRGVTSQKNWFFINTAVITSNIASVTSVTWRWLWRNEVRTKHLDSPFDDDGIGQRKTM
jgi:hypothetical protein